MMQYIDPLVNEVTASPLQSPSPHPLPPDGKGEGDRTGG